MIVFATRGNVSCARKQRGAAFGGKEGWVAKTRIGRPPRTDRPTRIAVLLPGTLRAWLTRQAEIERRSQGDLLAAALESYKARVARRRSR